MIEISKVFNARVYIDSIDFIAKAEEVDLPKIKFKFADTKALGLYADSELPTGLDKMEARLKFNSVYPEFIKLAADPFTTKNHYYPCAFSGMDTARSSKDRITES